MTRVATRLVVLESGPGLESIFAGLGLELKGLGLGLGLATYGLGLGLRSFSASPSSPLYKVYLWRGCSVTGVLY